MSLIDKLTGKNERVYSNKPLRAAIKTSLFTMAASAMMPFVGQVAQADDIHKHGAKRSTGAITESTPLNGTGIPIEDAQRVMESRRAKSDARLDQLLGGQFGLPGGISAPRKDALTIDTRYPHISRTNFSVLSEGQDPREQTPSERLTLLEDALGKADMGQQYVAATLYQPAYFNSKKKDSIESVTIIKALNAQDAAVIEQSGFGVAYLIDYDDDMRKFGLTENEFDVIDQVYMAILPGRGGQVGIRHDITSERDGYDANVKPFFSSLQQLVTGNFLTFGLQYFTGNIRARNLNGDMRKAGIREHRGMLALRIENDGKPMSYEELMTTIPRNIQDGEVYLSLDPVSCGCPCPAPGKEVVTERVVETEPEYETIYHPNYKTGEIDLNDPASYYTERRLVRAGGKEVIRETQYVPGTVTIPDSVTLGLNLSKASSTQASKIYSAGEAEFYIDGVEYCVAGFGINDEITDDSGALAGIVDAAFAYYANEKRKEVVEKEKIVREETIIYEDREVTKIVYQDRVVYVEVPCDTPNGGQGGVPGGQPKPGGNPNPYLTGGQGGSSSGVSKPSGSTSTGSSGTMGGISGGASKPSGSGSTFSGGSQSGASGAYGGGVYTPSGGNSGGSNR